MQHTFPDTSEHVGQSMAHTQGKLLFSSADRKLLSVQQRRLLVIKKSLLHAEG